MDGRIAAGETEETEAFFAGLIEVGVRVIQPDVGRCGGLTTARRLATLAHRSDLWCVPHCFGPGVNLAASVQWMAASEEAPFNEYPLTESPLRNDLVIGLPRLVDGWVEVSASPALGIAIDEAVAQRFRMAGSSQAKNFWTAVRHASDVNHSRTKAGIWIFHGMRKEVLGLIACTLVVWAMTQPGMAADPSLYGTLRVAANGWIIQKFPLQQAAQDFMKRNPGVRVKVIPNDDSTFVNQYLLAWAHGHNPADLGIGGTPGQLAVFVAKDYLAPWTDFFPARLAGISSSLHIYSRECSRVSGTHCPSWARS